MSSRPFVRTIGKSRPVTSRANFCINHRVSHPSSVPEVWGDDAHVFNPRRYLNRQKKEGVPTVGVYGDVLTFCTSWLLDSLLLGCSHARVPRRCWFPYLHRLEILVSPMFQLQTEGGETDI